MDDTEDDVAEAVQFFLLLLVFLNSFSNFCFILFKASQFLGGTVTVRCSEPVYPHVIQLVGTFFTLQN